MKIKLEDKYFIFDKPINNSLKECLKTIYLYFRANFYKLYLIVAKKNQIKCKKYKVSICAIFKDESKYLKEWLEYHIIVGVDHFYLYNNCSSDEYDDVLQPYINQGIVTLIDWPYEQSQIQAYENCIKCFSDESHWIGFIDIDEFVVPIKTNNIYDFLQKYEKKYPAVLIYWRVFGTSGHITSEQNELLTEKYFLAWEKLNNIGKCFYNTNFEYAFNNEKNACLHHVFWGKVNNVAVPPINCFGKITYYRLHLANKKEVPIQINHYVTKSLEDYYKKCEKSDVFFKENPRYHNRAFEIDLYSTKPDYKIFRYMAKLKINMQSNCQKENCETKNE